MSWFSREVKKENSPCAHRNALPRWDRMEDSGDPQRISRLYCPDCDQFLPASAVPSWSGGATLSQP